MFSFETSVMKQILTFYYVINSKLVHKAVPQLVIPKYILDMRQQTDTPAYREIKLKKKLLIYDS